LVANTDILLLLGGSWHNFDGFATRVTPCLSEAGFAVRVSYDLDDWTSLEAEGSSIVILYTCLDEATAYCHTDAHIEGLCRWVSAGGGLLAIHSATVAARRHSNLKSLIGGSFISHPPRARFVVTPVADGHPIIQGVDPFAIEDELYLHDVDPSVRVHLFAQHQGQTQPLAWTRQQGRGKVAYFALGHDQAAWDLPEYQKFVLQSLGWLVR
jgi:type 1 glutamine amidotransferase